jgi:hypothetical protein
LIVVPGQWKQQWVPHYHQESVHKTFAIEMIRGPVTASSVPPRQAVFGQGPIGAGIFGVVPGMTWDIVEREGECGGQGDCAMLGNLQ